MADVGHHPARQTAAGSCLLLGGATACAQLMSVLFWMPHQGHHLIWLPGAVLLCGLLAMPKEHWPASTLAAWASVVLVLGALGFPLGIMLVLLGGIFALVAAAAFALVQLRSRYRVLADFPGLAWFLLIACVALPALGAAWVLGVLTTFSSKLLIPDSWLSIALGHGLAYAIVVPAWLSRLSSIQRDRVQSEMDSKVIATGLGLVILLMALWRLSPDIAGMSAAQLAAPLLLLVWCFVALSAVTACSVMMLTVLIMLRLSLIGYGPLAGSVPKVEPLGMQLWLFGLAVALLAVATLREQRRMSRDALVRANRRLGVVAGRLIAAQEDERRRIARDLHDDINQSLASISINLSALKREVNASPLLGRIQEQVVAVSTDVRRLSHGLHPSTLRYMGLEAALSALCRAHDGRAGLKMHLDLSSVPSMPEPNALCLYRISQEAMCNIEKHAHATFVVVSLRSDASGVRLEIADNGMGFAVDGASRDPVGLGLISMEERLNVLGGSLHIRSAPGKGTTICALLPCSA